jgi:hypothetical protein
MTQAASIGLAFRSLLWTFLFPGVFAGPAGDKVPRPLRANSFGRFGLWS